jgi:hypothetical protein
MRGRAALASLVIGILVCGGREASGAHKTGTPRPAGAVTLFDVSFSKPEQTTGQGVNVVPPGTQQKYPSAIPSNVFMGHPRVVAELCGLDKQPARLSVGTGEHGIEGLEFLLDQRYGHYHVELDLCIAKIDPPPLASQAMQVAVFLDIPEAYALGFESGGDAVVIDPNLAPETREKPRPVGKFEVGKPMHLSFDVDLEKQTWRVEKDGKVLLDAALRADIPRAVRVIVRGNPTTTAAVDDFLIWAEHDLTKNGTAPPAPITGPETYPEN